MADIYFEGDPAVDSSRRHMERVLMGEPPRRKWPFVLAALGGGLWALWRMAAEGAAARETRRSARAPEQERPPNAI